MVKSTAHHARLWIAYGIGHASSHAALARLKDPKIKIDVQILQYVMSGRYIYAFLVLT